MDHFAGKPPLEHVIEARRKGKAAASEIHGEELSGHVSAAANSSKETAVLLILLGLLFGEPPPMLLAFLLGWLLWKTGRSAILGWRRLERLHRLIEEERFEIEHHRNQEKQELKALYAAKGFSGRLLDEIVEVLMADDNRLLQVMLEEELGLSLETYEHPLKQASGAFLGVIGSSIMVAAGYYVWNPYGALLAAGLAIALASGTTAQLEKNHITSSIIWNLAVSALAIGCAFFFKKFLLG